MGLSRKRVSILEFATDDCVADLPCDQFGRLGDTHRIRIAATADRDYRKSIRQFKFLDGRNTLSAQNPPGASDKGSLLDACI